MRRNYPEVVSEFDTLKAVVAGASIARYGDGELKMCRTDAPDPVGIKSQRGDAALTVRLKEILLDSGACLVGIPNVHEVVKQHVSDQKVTHWAKHVLYRTFLAERTYYSSFITRPDSAPWIHTPDYWQLLESLWIDQDVMVVRGSGKSLTTDDLIGARSVTEILCPRQHAWFEYDAILARILAGNPSRVLLGLGPTATVLAVDLCARGIHALDLGHVAMFLRKYRKGITDPQLTHDEKYTEIPA